MIKHRKEKYFYGRSMFIEIRKLYGEQREVKNICTFQDVYKQYKRPSFYRRMT